MKNINTYINERLSVTSKSFYTCQPKTKRELTDIITDRVKAEGLECDLNDIDVSKITDMSYLFINTDVFKKFNGDISMWDVSNVKNMTEMFWGCEKFNCDLSRWNVSNVEKTSYMFWGCHEFNSDLSKWDMSNVTEMHCMFQFCESFKQNLDRWDVSKVVFMNNAFEHCPTHPKWYIKWNNDIDKLNK